MQVPSLVVLLLALFLCSVNGAGTTAIKSSTTTSYNTSRIELDPDPATVSGNCTTNFSSTLTSMVSTWFVLAVANDTGSYPSTVTNPDKFLSMGVFQKAPLSFRELGDSTVDDQDERQRRLPCSTTSCNNCCPANCCALCNNNGNCQRCRRLGGSSRQLQDNSWWNGDANMQARVATWIQTAARKWLNESDPTLCMGDASKLIVKVNYY